MDKYIAGLYLPTYDTKEEAIERAKEVSAANGRCRDSVYWRLRDCWR